MGPGHHDEKNFKQEPEPAHASLALLPQLPYLNVYGEKGRMREESFAVPHGQWSGVNDMSKGVHLDQQEVGTEHKGPHAISAPPMFMSSDELRQLAWEALHVKAAEAQIWEPKKRKRRRRHKRFRQKMIFPFGDSKKGVWDEKLLLVSHLLPKIDIGIAITEGLNQSS